MSVSNKHSRVKAGGAAVASGARSARRQAANVPATVPNEGDALAEVKAIHRDAQTLLDRIENFEASHRPGCGCRLCGWLADHGDRVEFQPFRDQLTALRTALFHYTGTTYADLPAHGTV